MTSAAEAIARTECADLHRRIAILEGDLDAAETCKHRLNTLIVARDNEIERVTAPACQAASRA